MIRILADENVPPALAIAVRQRIPGIDIETTHEVQIDGFSDPELLQWASERKQVVLTMDHRTMPEFANERLAKRKLLPGLLVVHGGRTLRELVDEIEVVVCCLAEADFENQVIHIPLS
jgi:hypothetical protein